MKSALFLLVVLLIGNTFASHAELRAQAPKKQPKTFAEQQKAYEDSIRDAQQTERFGYILAGLGIALVLAAIPISIYLDRKKKARKQAGASPPAATSD